jgi:hypothetical protein
MKLKFAIVCDNAFVDSDGRLSIIQAFDTIFAPNFPAIHPRVSIVTNYSIESDTHKSPEYKQTLKMINVKTGKEIFKMERAIKPSAGRDSYVQYIANILGVTFPNEGKYDIVAQLNGEDFGTVASIKVSKETN